MRFYSIVYPGYLQLKKEEFLDFKFEGKEIRFLLRRQMKPLVIFDAFNEFSDDKKCHIKTNKGYGLTTQKGGIIYSKNGEIQDPYSFQVTMERLPEMRIFYNTRCSHLFFIDKSSSDKPDFEFAERLIQYFILIYKRTLNDVFVQEFKNLTSPYLVLESGMCTLISNGHYDFKTDSLKALWDRFISDQMSLNTNPDKAFENIKINLNSGNTMDYKEIFIKAQEEIYINKNFKYALLEVFIFVEQILVRALKTIKISKGISNQTIKNFNKEVGIGYMLNVEIPLVIEDYALHKEVFSNVDKIRKKRNDVVHNGETVSEEEARFAVDNSYTLYNLLKGYFAS